MSEAQRRIGFVFRPYPDHSLLKFCSEVNPCMVIGDENPLRETERWRARVSRDLRLPFWTVDADVAVPSKLLEKEQYSARTIRPRLHRLLPQFLPPSDNPPARVSWTGPVGLPEQTSDPDFTRSWTIDRDIAPARGWIGGSKEGMRRLKAFFQTRLGDYADNRVRPEIDGTSRLSPYLHFGHLGPHTVASAVWKADASEVAKQAFLE